MLRGAALCMLVLLAGCESTTSDRAPAMPAALDWNAPNRWVHVDNIAKDRIALFEGARQRWLLALHRDGAHLTDGRALFWSGDHGDVRTYLTFYPFTNFADLDARARTAKVTQGIVGKAAVDDYDSGDAALVPPHYTQIWIRRNAEDFVSPIAGDLSELSAGSARVQIQQLDFARSERAEAVWNEVKAALEKARYPLTCRTFTAWYGDGRTERLWLAPDVQSLQAAPSLRAAIANQSGSALADEYEALWQLQDEFEISRRGELSNLVR
jgi:hypothetical protein